MSTYSGKRVSAFAKLNGKSKQESIAKDSLTDKEKSKRVPGKRKKDKETLKSTEASQVKAKANKKSKAKPKVNDTENEREENDGVENERKEKRNSRSLKVEESSKKAKSVEKSEVVKHSNKDDKQEQGSKRKYSRTRSSDRSSNGNELETNMKCVKLEALSEPPVKRKGKRGQRNFGRFESVGRKSEESDKSDSPSIYISDDSNSDVVIEPELPADDVIITKCSVGKTTSSEEIQDEDEFSPFPIKVGDGVLVVLSHPSEYIIKGKASVCTVTGAVTVQGYHLQTDTPVNIFSPDTNSLLTVKTLRPETNIKQTVSKCTEICKQNNCKNIPDLKSVLKRFESFVVLHIHRNHSNTLDAVTSFDLYSKLFNVEEDTTNVNEMLVPLGVALLVESMTPCMEINNDLENVLRMWSGEDDNKECPKSILVCGGKDCGKSTTNRLLMNSTFNRVDNSEDLLYYLELDVGQSEFTPPGCVSLVKVTEPLLGPPFCHQKEPVYAYAYGGLTPSDDPDRYLQCVQACVTRYRQLGSPGRLVINTMGWMKGLGYQLLVDTVNLIQPQCIVQLTSAQRSRNTAPLTEGFFCHTSWSDLSRDRNLRPVSRCPAYKPDIIHLENPVTPWYMSKYQASDHRNLALLSHLCHDLDPLLTLTSVAPYSVRWEDIAVGVYGVDVSPSQVMYALNGSLMALCKTNRSQAKQTVDGGPLFFKSLPVCEWLGYGIVRGIDTEKKLFYLVTLLPKDKLEKVNTFLKGSVLVPGQLTLSQKCPELPYVDIYTKSLGSAAVKPRHHMPRRNLRPKDGSTPSASNSKTP